MATPCCSFELEHTHAAARTGTLTLPHGTVRTPAFMPVGTRGTVRGLTNAELIDVGTEMVLANTYHLWVRPTASLIERMGGLHRFMGWDGPILTDSGGYQVFSMRDRNRVSERGVKIRSPEDGNWRLLTPEVAIEVQEQLAVDVAMAFDECLEQPADRDRTARSTDRTTRWLHRCIEARRHPERTALFGIVQGGLFEDLRVEHAQTLSELDLDGYAIGGLSVGEVKDQLFHMTEVAAGQLPRTKVRYLMGVGHPVDIVDAVLRGVDLFDCVLPTRSGRHGQAYTSVGRTNFRNRRWAEVDDVIDPACDCLACRTTSRAYMRHLIKCDELLGRRLLSHHNLRYYQRLMQRLRAAIEVGDDRALAELRDEAARATAPVDRPGGAG